MSVSTAAERYCEHGGWAAVLLEHTHTLVREFDAHQKNSTYNNIYENNYNYYKNLSISLSAESRFGYDSYTEY